MLNGFWRHLAVRDPETDDLIFPPSQSRQTQRTQDTQDTHDGRNKKKKTKSHILSPPPLALVVQGTSVVTLW